MAARLKLAADTAGSTWRALGLRPKALLGIGGAEGACVRESPRPTVVISMITMGMRVVGVLLLMTTASYCGVNINVLTQHNDSFRTGANLNESLLTPANVNAGQFGKSFDLPVDGYVYAQPLYVSGISITAGNSPGIHNLVIVATEHDSVYAFDADSNTGVQPLWKASFVDEANGVSTVPSGDVGSNDITPEIGITSTPVIDGATGTLFVLAKTKRFNPLNPGDQTAWSYEQKLHALDIRTGMEKPNSPVVIRASTFGTGDGSNGTGIVAFDPLRQLNRPGLLLLNGVVYIAWASHGDFNPYHGWVLGYNKTTLAQVAVYNTTPNGAAGGIWMSGAGLSADSAGHIFLATGNGSFDVDNNGLHTGSSFGNAVLSMATSKGGALTQVDFFTPHNQAGLTQSDLDLGSGGVVLLPGQSGPYPRIAVTVGKDGTIYLLNRDNLGGYNGAYDAIVQEMPRALGESWTTPAYFDGSLYFHAANDVLKRFPLWASHIPAQPTSQGSSSFDFPGATPSISANGIQNAIVWEIQSVNPSVLIAYDANDLSKQLYTSNQAANSRDVPGNGVKFAVPTVANGKVYVGTQDRVSVYGLIHDPSLLSVSVVGDGSVSPEFSGTTSRIVNQTYAISATPGTGNLLSGWRDLSSGRVISHSNTLTFTMSQNLALAAEFVPNPFPPLVGNYSGLSLVQDPSRQWGGGVSLTLNSTGGFSAKIPLGSDVISLHGSFLADGTFTTTLTRPGKALVSISLRLDLNGGSQQITGTISNGLLTGNITANHANPFASSGPFTLVLAHPSDPSQPQGDGYGVGTVDALGNLRFAGVLGDGSRVSQGTIVSGKGEWLLFAAPYGSNGSITGTLKFENLVGSDLDGTLRWFKTTTSSPAILSTISGTGSFYNNFVVPVIGQSGSFTFSATGGGLSPAPNPILFTLGLDNKISVAPGAGKLAMNFRLTNGMFSGQFTDAALQTHAYSGVVLQKSATGNGLFTVKGKPGAIRIAQ